MPLSIQHTAVPLLPKVSYASACRAGIMGARCSLRGGPPSGEAPGNHWQWQHQTQQELSTWPLYGVAIQQVGSNVQGTEMSSTQFLLPPFLRQTMWWAVGHGLSCAQLSLDSCGAPVLPAPAPSCTANGPVLCHCQVQGLCSEAPVGMKM